MKLKCRCLYMVWNKCLSTNQRLLRMQAAQSTIQLLSIWISTLGELNNPIGTWLIAAFLLKVFPISRTLKCMRGVSFGGFPWLVSLVGLLFCGCLFVSACLFVLVHALKNCHFFSFLTNLEVNLQVSLLPKLEPNFAASRDLSQIL